MPIRRRDILLLPLIAVLASVVLIESTDMALRKVYTTSNEHLGRCLDYAHATAGIPGIPNCSVYDKAYDTPLIQYHFNACGMRSQAGCEAASPGTYRIALLGSSIAFGQWVQYEDTIAHQLEIDVSRADGKKIEVANYGRMQEIPPLAARLLPEVLKKKPRLVVLVVSPYDVGVSTTDPVIAMRVAQKTTENHLRWWIDYIRSLFLTNSLSQIADTLQSHLKNRIYGSRAATFILIFEYQKKQRYIRQYVRGQDSEIGYLPVHTSEAWRQSYLAFDRSIQQMSMMTHQVNIPFAVVLLPTHAQVNMLISGSWPPRYDPYLIDNRVREIVQSEGGIFLDIFSESTRIPNFGEHYFFQNGHPDGYGQTVFARLIAEQLTGGAVPELRAKSTTGAAH